VQAACCRLLYDRWREDDAQICESISYGSGDPSYFETLYVAVLTAQGNYRQALEYAERAVRPIAGRTSLPIYLAAVTVKALALLHLGRWGDVLRISREGRDAERNGMFLFREAWLRTVALDFDGVRRLCQTGEAAAVHPRIRAVDMVAWGYAE